MQGYTLKRKNYLNISQNQVIEFNLAGLPQGRYFLKLSDGFDERVFQLIRF
jgi:hypothetical protein